VTVAYPDKQAPPPGWTFVVIHNPGGFSHPAVAARPYGAAEFRPVPQTYRAWPYSGLLGSPQSAAMVGWPDRGWKFVYHYD
jgi:hypothetical protein